MNQQFDKQNQKQPTSGQLKKSLALQLAVYRQIAIARRLTFFVANLILRAIRKTIRLLLRLKPALATAVVVLSPFVFAQDSSANVFTQQAGSDNPFSVSVGFLSAPTLADLDGDGDLDAVVGDNNIKLNYFENVGSAMDPNFEKRYGTHDPFGGSHP